MNQKQIKGQLKDVIVRMTEVYPSGNYPSGGAGCLAFFNLSNGFISYCHRDVHKEDSYHVSVLDRWSGIDASEIVWTDQG